MTGDRFEPLLLKILQAQRIRGPPAGVETVELATLRIPHDGEEIAADPIACGLHEAQHGVGGDGRVDCVASCFQDVQSHLSCKRLTGGCHGVGGDDLRSSREGLAGNPVGGDQTARRKEEESKDY